MSFANHPVPSASQPARPLTPTGGDGVANGDRADAAPAERWTDRRGRGRGRRAPRLGGVPYQRGRWRARFWVIRLPRRCPRRVSGCVQTLVGARSGQASRGGKEVHPLLGACGRCRAVPAGSGHVGTGSGSWNSRLFPRVRSAPRVSGTERSGFSRLEASICWRCALRRRTWLRPPEPGRKLPTGGFRLARLCRTEARRRGGFCSQNFPKLQICARTTGLLCGCWFRFRSAPNKAAGW